MEVQPRVVEVHHSFLQVHACKVKFGRKFDANAGRQREYTEEQQFSSDEKNKPSPT